MSQMLLTFLSYHGLLYSLVTPKIVALVPLNLGQLQCSHLGKHPIAVYDRLIAVALCKNNHFGKAT